MSFEGETKDMLIEQLANHMKISYVNWKNETVNDEYIFDDIQRISEETVEIPDNLSLSDVKQPKPNVEKRSFNGKKKFYKKKPRN